MRVWEQGLVATYSMPGYKALIEEHYRAYQRPDTVIEIHGVKDEAGDTAAKIAGRVVNYAYLHRMHDTQILKNVLRAEQEGFDVVLLGVLQDPGLKEARSIVDIPVLGYGEVSMLTACTLGERFSFLCINPQMDQLVQQTIRERGMAARAAPTTYMECGYDTLYAGVQGKTEAFMRAFEAAAQRAIDQGADVILPGQTIIAELLWKAGITRFNDAVVLDPRLPMLRMAEMMVDMRKAGMSACRRGFYWAKPPADLTAAMNAFYGE
ncbi:MAG: aspartate/glutamate racemase family protein [Burkholderiales bacterium]